MTGWEEVSRNKVGRSNKFTIDSTNSLVFWRSLAAGEQAYFSRCYLTGWDEVSRNKVGRSNKFTIDSTNSLVFRSSFATSIQANISRGYLTGWEEVPRNKVGRSKSSPLTPPTALYSGALLPRVFRLISPGAT